MGSRLGTRLRALLGRRPGAPTWVQDALPDAERALASAGAQDGTWLVGTRVGLWRLHRDDRGAVEADRLPWERVQRADWDTDTSTLRVEEMRDFGQPVAAAAYVLEEPGLLLQLVRERVTASIVVQRRVELGRKRGLTVIGRRPPDGSGGVTWAYELDRGVDPDDPAVRQAAEAALREAQESLGS